MASSIDLPATFEQNIDQDPSSPGKVKMIYNGGNAFKCGTITGCGHNRDHVWYVECPQLVSYSPTQKRKKKEKDVDTYTHTEDCKIEGAF